MTLFNIVLVGVDGSPASGTALRYAVAEADRRGARLRVVSTYFPEYSVHGRTQPVTASEGAIEVDLEKETRRMVEDALAGDSPQPPVEIVVAAGPTAGVLIDKSAEVDVLVLGHRGRGGFASMLLGSVGLQCVQHARCPVSGDRGAPARRIGVGVDRGARGQVVGASHSHVERATVGSRKDL